MRLLRILLCTSKVVSLYETDTVTIDIAVLLYETKT